MAHFHILADQNDHIEQIAIRQIATSDIVDALRRGWMDFIASPSHYLFVALIYPIVGILLALWTSGNNALPMLYPLATGFALIGPFAGIGLYEMSRRREQGLDTSWRHALEVVHSPAIPSILAVGVMLFAIFYCWLALAQGLYESLLGPAAPSSIWDLVRRVVSTPEGWALFVYGNLIGFGFALLTLATTVVAFPLLLDRDVGAAAAISTSVRAVFSNPVPMLFWGLVVAVALLLGSIPLFVGLAIVMPVLAHTTWHIYRKVVVGRT